MGWKVGPRPPKRIDISPPRSERPDVTLGKWPRELGRSSRNGTRKSVSESKVEDPGSNPKGALKSHSQQRGLRDKILPKHLLKASSGRTFRGTSGGHLMGVSGEHSRGTF